MKRLLLFATVAAVCFALLFSVVSFAQDCADVRRDVLRLHVVAASDSQVDQHLKLLVRDAVLERGAEIFDGTVTADEAESIIAPKTDELVKAAQEVLRANGCDCAVNVTVGEEYFATRCYEEFTMPAGVYTAVRVNIGPAQGENWWCVMFPPLCLPSAFADADAFFDGDEMRVISASPKYEPRFKIVEVIESVRSRLNSRN
ncbi:MAG: stage II sporulation protein R [Clostridia bacterium]|nr:stage II sporulation protein R [Clostridia bacterium]